MSDKLTSQEQAAGSSEPVGANEDSRKSFLGLGSHHLKTLGVTIGLFVMLLSLLHFIRPSTMFSAELFVSELKFSLTASALLLPPTTGIRGFELGGGGTIRIPRGIDSADGSVLGESAVPGNIVLVAGNDSAISLEGFVAAPGVEILAASSGYDKDVALWFERTGDSESEGWSTIRLSLDGSIDFITSGGEPHTRQFSIPEGLDIDPPGDAFELGLTLREIGRPLFAPSLDVDSLHFLITADLLDARYRGRVDESSIISGQVTLHAIDDDSVAIRPGEGLRHAAARDLRIEDISLTPEGFRVKYSGWARSLLLRRRGEDYQLSPSLLRRAYRTEGGRLITALVFAIYLVLLEFLLDSAARRSGTP